VPGSPYADATRPRVAALAAAAFVGVGCLSGPIEDRFASVVERYTPDPLAAEDAPWADATQALGPPDGRTVAVPLGSLIVLRFFRDIPDGRGPDFRVVEGGTDGAAAWVAISADGVTFAEYPSPARAGVATPFDLADLGLPRVAFVRVRGVDALGLDPGFDLDALEALH
jgi:hypothetical protein